MWRSPKTGLPSTIENASGPHIHDPRSGEILETDIQFYHNVMNLGARRLYVLLRVCGWCISGLVTFLGRYHECVRYPKKPLHVIRIYLPRH